MTTVRFDAGWERELYRDPQLRPLLDDVCGDLEDAIADAAPKRGRPRLAPSFRHGVDRDAGGIFGWVGTDSSFWHLPEYGTAHHPAEPYIRPQLYGRVD